MLLGISQGFEQYADYVNMIAEWISERLGVVPITSMSLWVAYDQNLDFFCYMSWASSVMSSKVRLGSVGYGWDWSPENYCPCLVCLVMLKASRPECNVAPNERESRPEWPN